MPVICNSRRHHASAAFTLLEASIVIAIIGLLVGGIVATRTYLRTAELVSMVNEGKNYLKAAKQFERMYSGAMPGDMSNASSYWSGAGNGDGNTVIGNLNTEYFLAFQHLSRAGMITGNYTGVAGGAGALDADLGVNVPKSPIKKIGYSYGSGNAGGMITGSGTFYDGYYGVFVRVGSDTAGNSLPVSGFMTTQEAFELDTKFDNGLASSGFMRGLKDSCTSVVSTGPDIANYNLANSWRDLCSIILSAS